MFPSYPGLAVATKILNINCMINWLNLIFLLHSLNSGYIHELNATLLSIFDNYCCNAEDIYFKRGFHFIFVGFSKLARFMKMGPCMAQYTKIPKPMLILYLYIYKLYIDKTC